MSIYGGRQEHLGTYNLVECTLLNPCEYLPNQVGKSGRIALRPPAW